MGQSAISGGRGCLAAAIGILLALSGELTKCGKSREVEAEFQCLLPQFEDVSVVPTPVFFNGVREGEETGMAIEPGARVKKGDPLLSLEAMKM